jgi:two-component system KDP operon response regulator KdpE
MESESRILIVEDDPSLARALALNLKVRGYLTDVAPDGTHAMQLAVDHHPDLVVLDLGLPDMDGTEVITGLRTWTPIPIIVLSARQSSHDKVRALDAGADDYVTKPFAMDELLARLRAALRRSQPDTDEAIVVSNADFTIDLGAHVVSRNGETLRLTPREWGLLELLVQHRGRLVSQKQLLQQVWGPQYESETHYLRVYVGHLRQKLEPEPSQPRYIITEPGMGYRFVAD